MLVCVGRGARVDGLGRLLVGLDTLPGSLLLALLLVVVRADQVVDVATAGLLGHAVPVGGGPDERTDHAADDGGHGHDEPPVGVEVHGGGDGPAEHDEPHEREDRGDAAAPHGAVVVLDPLVGGDGDELGVAHVLHPLPELVDRADDPVELVPADVPGVEVALRPVAALGELLLGAVQVLRGSATLGGSLLHAGDARLRDVLGLGGGLGRSLLGDDLLCLHDGLSRLGGVLGRLVDVGLGDRLPCRLSGGEGVGLGGGLAELDAGGVHLRLDLGLVVLVHAGGDDGRLTVLLLQALQDVLDAADALVDLLVGGLAHESDDVVEELRAPGRLEALAVVGAGLFLLRGGHVTDFQCGVYRPAVAGTVMLHGSWRSVRLTAANPDIAAITT